MTPEIRSAPRIEGKAAKAATTMGSASEGTSLLAMASDDVEDVGDEAGWGGEDLNL